MEQNYVAARPSKNAENLSSASFSSKCRSLLLAASVGALATDPTVQAMDAFTLKSSVKDGVLTYTLSSEFVPTLGPCYSTSLEIPHPNNSPVAWTSLPSGWAVTTNGSYSDLRSDQTNIIGKSAITFTLQPATPGVGYSLCTNATFGFNFFYGTMPFPWSGYGQFNCLVPDSSSTNANPPSTTSTISWPCEAQFVGVTPTNVSIVANTDMQGRLQTSTNLNSWSNLGSPVALSSGVTNKIPYSAQDPQGFLRFEVQGPKL